MQNNEETFERELRNNVTVAKKECRYNATYFNQMLDKLGGVQTAKRLIAKAIQTGNPSDGFTTLLLCGRLELTMEASVIKDEFRDLFSSEEISYCKSVLGVR